MIEVIWIILQQNNRYLLAKRSVPDLSGYIWSFPHGSYDKLNSDIIKTSQKILQTDVGVIGRRFRKLFRTSVHAHSVTSFLCDKWNGKLKPNNIDIFEIKWLTLYDICMLGSKLSQSVDENLLHFSYLTQHYKHHPEEWIEKWIECDEDD